ncbi:LAFE_0C07008g1_1 [Lachancea fermentati]|uniref:Acyl-coenzyme A diphosphatase SCS3 n=1 Tax=Lachancea fermentati TaxID=4955 RepID=A0A1G4MA23_LACFM|nr:LAFE_0C07008g1_1 [Lachancea fermentati]
MNRYQVFLFSLCPATFVIGNLISYWTEELQVDKDNWVNTWFIKQGWFWTSLIGWWCVVRYGGFGRYGTWKKTLARYAVLTIWWYLFTQSVWSGIAPIMDLVFMLSGGRCNFDIFDPSEPGSWKLNEKYHDTATRRQKSLTKLYRVLKQVANDPSSSLTNIVSQLEGWLVEGTTQLLDTDITPAQVNEYIDDFLHTWQKINSSYICRSLGGYWTGGHDPSGHIFLITLMCMFLLGELQVVGRRAWRKLSSSRPYLKILRIHLIKIFTTGGILNFLRNPFFTRELLMECFIFPPFTCVKELAIISAVTLKFIIWDNPVIILTSLVVMWWSSFLLTTLAFHTISEQISGLICAYIVAGLVYWKLK